MSTKSVSKDHHSILLIRFVIRVLARARDLCVQSLTGCGGNVNYGNAMGCPTPHIPALPRSFSTNSNMSSADELIRVSSTRGKIADVDSLRRSKSSPAGGGGGSGGGGATIMARSRTVAIGRIDEEKSFEIENNDDDDDIGLLRRGARYPRSGSSTLLSRGSKVAV